MAYSYIPTAHIIMMSVGRLTSRVLRSVSFTLPAHDHKLQSWPGNAYNSTSLGQPTKSADTIQPRLHNSKLKSNQGCPIYETPVIHDLCSSIQIAASTRQCLGILQADLEKKYHKIWLTPIGEWFKLVDTLQFVPWHSGSVTLRSLLEGPTNLNRFPLKDRLSLGVKLASSVIQLHQTRWLTDSWGKHDIIFFTHPQTRDPITEKPMVLHNFSSSTSTSAARGGVAYRQNKVLFWLGVVLWELWFRKSLMETTPDDVQAGSNPETHSQELPVDSSRNIQLCGAAAKALSELVD